MRDQKEIHESDWTEKSGAPEAELFGPYKHRINACVDLVAELRPASLLDVGCGTGHIAGLIKRRLPAIEIDGVDISRFALEKAEVISRKFEVNIDAGNVPCEDNSYDCVLCAEILEHLYDPPHALAEVYRILRPGGAAVLTTPNYGLIHNRLTSLAGGIPQTMLNPQHIRFYTYDSMSELAVAAGFSVSARYGARRRLNALAAVWPPLLSEWVILRLNK